MTLKEQLMEDFKTAMKSHDEVAKTTISFVRAAIKQVEIDKKVELQDEDIFPIISKQVKMRKDAISEFEKGGRDDLISDYQKEIDVLAKYMPAQMSEDEIKQVVTQAAADMGIEGGKQNMGKLMGAVMPKVKGKADGNEVRKIITDFLA